MFLHDVCTLKEDRKKFSILHCTRGTRCSLTLKPAVTRQVEQTSHGTYIVPVRYVARATSCCRSELAEKTGRSMWVSRRAVTPSISSFPLRLPQVLRHGVYAETARSVPYSTGYCTYVSRHTSTALPLMFARSWRRPAPSKTPRASKSSSPGAI